MRFRMPALTALLTAGVLVLTGCVPPPDVVVPAEPSGVQPVFASDEEALAAAVAAYEEYARVSDEIGHDGGEGADRIAEYVTAGWLQTELKGFAELQGSGNRLIGNVVLSNPQLQQVWEDPIGEAHVAMYACLELSNSRVVDSSGDDITPVDREASVPIEVTLQSSEVEPGRLKIAEVTPWPGSGICSVSG